LSGSTNKNTKARIKMEISMGPCPADKKVTETDVTQFYPTDDVIKKARKINMLPQFGITFVGIDRHDHKQIQKELIRALKDRDIDGHVFENGTIRTNDPNWCNRTADMTDISKEISGVMFIISCNDSIMSDAIYDHFLNDEALSCNTLKQIEPYKERLFEWFNAEVNLETHAVELYSDDNQKIFLVRMAKKLMIVRLRDPGNGADILVTEDASLPYTEKELPPIAIDLLKALAQKTITVY